MLEICINLWQINLISRFIKIAKIKYTRNFYQFVAKLYQNGEFKYTRYLYQIKYIRISKSSILEINFAILMNF